MLVERRNNHMPIQTVARILLVWLVISLVLFLTSISISSNETYFEHPNHSYAIPLLSPIIGTVTAELLARIAMPATMLGIAMLLAARITSQLIGQREAVMTCLAMALSVPLLFLFAPLQVEQDGLQVICLLISINGLLARNPRSGAWVAGLSMAAWLSFSLNAWPFVLFICAIGALRWLRNRSGRFWLVYITQALAVGSIGIFLAARGMHDLAQYCGGLGLTHIAMLCWVALIISVLSRVGPTPSGALLGGFALAGAGAVAMLLLGAPSCTSQNVPIWQQDLSFALENLALPLLGIWAAIHLAARNADWLRHWWFDYALLTTASLAVVIFSSRGGAIAAALAVVPLGWQLCQWLDQTARMKNSIKRGSTLALIAMLLMPSIVPKLIPMIDPGHPNDNVAHNTDHIGNTWPYG